MNHEEAQEVGDVLAQSIDVFLMTPEGERREVIRHQIAELLWDHKIGIAMVLREFGERPR